MSSSALDVFIDVDSSYLQAQFLRIKSRRGAKKAILAVAASTILAATLEWLNPLESQIPAVTMARTRKSPRSPQLMQ